MDADASGAVPTIEEFATALEDKWKVGAKGTDRGVLLIVSLNPRKYRIEVGYGLEGLLNDAKVGDIGREMVPYLRAGDYSQGVSVGTQALAQDIAVDAGVTLAQPADGGGAGGTVSAAAAGAGEQYGGAAVWWVGDPGARVFDPYRAYRMAVLFPVQHTGEWRTGWRWWIWWRRIWRMAGAEVAVGLEDLEEEVRAGEARAEIFEMIGMS